METFNLHILGCGSALPTSRHALTSQVVDFRGKLFMIDCGEGSQLQFRAMKLNFSRLNHIFISHLHGDHCLGLPGLISTLGMLDRLAPLHIYAQPEAPQIFRPILDYFCRNLTYPVEFHCFDPAQVALIYEDRALKVSTIPLHHRVPCAGFLFEEKPKKPHIPPRRYAYCSDTAYSEKIIPHIAGVDLLYHEATYAEKDRANAEKYLHSSAQQAATLAQKAGVKQLIIGHFSARYPNEDQLLDEACRIFTRTSLAAEKLLIKI